MEDTGEEGGDSPANDQYDESVDEFGEGLVDTEDAQIQAKDGSFDGGDDGCVDQFVAKDGDQENLKVLRICDSRYVLPGAAMYAYIC